jgi:hypothetical protein
MISAVLFMIFQTRHYEHVRNEPFFPGMLEFMTSSPVIAMVWEGHNAVATLRRVMGLKTKPDENEPGAARYATDAPTAASSRAWKCCGLIVCGLCCRLFLRVRCSARSLQIHVRTRGGPHRCAFFGLCCRCRARNRTLVPRGLGGCGRLHVLLPALDTGVASAFAACARVVFAFRCFFPLRFVFVSFCFDFSSLLAPSWWRALKQ